jgi:hypothetical protein
VNLLKTSEKENLTVAATLEKLALPFLAFFSLVVMFHIIIVAKYSPDTN